MDSIWKLLHWTSRERMRVLLVLSFGEGAGAEKVKSLKEIEIKLEYGKDIVVIRVL